MTEEWPVRPAARLFYAQEKAETRAPARPRRRPRTPGSALYLLRPPIVLGPHAVGAKDLLPGPLAPLGRGARPAGRPLAGAAAGARAGRCRCSSSTRTTSARRCCCASSAPGRPAPTTSPATASLTRRDVAREFGPAAGPGARRAGPGGGPGGRRAAVPAARRRVGGGGQPPGDHGRHARRSASSAGRPATPASRRCARRFSGRRRTWSRPWRPARRSARACRARCRSRCRGRPPSGCSPGARVSSSRRRPGRARWRGSPCPRRGSRRRSSAGRSSGSPSPGSGSLGIAPSGLRCAK